MNAHDIISKLGGVSAVSLITKTKPHAVQQWKRIGIPSKFWHTLVAASAGMLGFSDLAASKPNP